MRCVRVRVGEGVDRCERATHERSEMPKAERTFHVSQLQRVPEKARRMRMTTLVGPYHPSVSWKIVRPSKRSRCTRFLRAACVALGRCEKAHGQCGCAAVSGLGSGRRDERRESARAREGVRHSETERRRDGETERRR